MPIHLALVKRSIKFKKPYKHHYYPLANHTKRQTYRRWIIIHIIAIHVVYYTCRLHDKQINIPHMCSPCLQRWHARRTRLNMNSKSLSLSLAARPHHQPHLYQVHAAPLLYLSTLFNNWKSQLSFA